MCGCIGKPSRPKVVSPGTAFTAVNNGIRWRSAVYVNTNVGGNDPHKVFAGLDNHSGIYLGGPYVHGDTFPVPENIIDNVRFFEPMVYASNLLMQPPPFSVSEVEEVVINGGEPPVKRRILQKAQA